MKLVEQKMEGTEPLILEVPASSGGPVPGHCL